MCGNGRRVCALASPILYFAYQQTLFLPGWCGIVVERLPVGTHIPVGETHLPVGKHFFLWGKPLFLWGKHAFLWGSHLAVRKKRIFLKGNTTWGLEGEAPSWG